MALDLRKLDVLIVDDNSHMRTLVMQVLKALGVGSIREAPDGMSAFAELKQRPTDIIITDWMMEPLNGLEFVQLVRTASDSVDPYVPVVMLTGHTEKMRVTLARDSGVNEFLAKPFSAKQLYARLAQVIEHPRPFIKTACYFGPDRRRRDNPAYKGPKRPSTD